MTKRQEKLKLSIAAIHWWEMKALRSLLEVSQKIKLPMERVLTFDVETTFQPTVKKADPSPFHPANFMVSFGCKRPKDEYTQYAILRHATTAATPNAIPYLIDKLKDTTLLVGHNIKFELLWLDAIDIEYRGPVWDTMLFEYVLARGQKILLDLDSCCERRGIKGKVEGFQEKYFDKGITPFNIPSADLINYGVQDILSTEELFIKQLEVLYD